MNITELTKIGLSDGEIKVYKALLELGECTKTILAKTSGIAPSNIYDVTNRLIEKGLVSKVERNGIAHFSAANPRHILDFVESKQKEIEKEKQLAELMLPALLAQFGQVQQKTGVEVFEGWNGLKTVFEDLLAECKSGDECFVFGASRGESDKQADIFFLKYSRAREEKGIHTRIIFNEELRTRKQRIEYFLQSKAYTVKFMQQNTPSEIMLYKNVTCINILTNSPITIRIRSSEVTQSFKQYFDTMWRIAK